MTKYQVVLWWSDADNAFLAMAPQLPGCIMDGETPEAALRALDEVIAMWMEDARESGWRIPEPAGKMVPVRDEFSWKPIELLGEAETTKPRALKTASQTKKSGRTGSARKSPKKVPQPA